MKPKIDPLSAEMMEDSLTQGSILTDTERTEVLSKLLAAKDDLLRHSSVIQDLEEDLYLWRKEYDELAGKTIPSLMEQLGEESIPIGQGALLTIKENLHCGITKDNQEEAFLWLENHGHASIIADTFTIKFDKGLREEADVTAKKLKKEGIEFSRKQEVNTNTLKALIKREIKDGVDVPFDTFSVYVPKTAEIKIIKK